MAGENINRNELPYSPNGGNGVIPHNPGPIPLSTYEALEDLFQPRGPTLHDFITLLRKRRKIVIATAIGFISLGLLYVIFTPSQYTATSTVEIRGYSPVIGEGELETLLQTDTRKILYQQTTTAKLEYLSLADDVLNNNGLGDKVKEYFDNSRSAIGIALEAAMKFLHLKSEDTDESDPRFTHRETFLNNYYKLIDIAPIHDTALVEVKATTTDRHLSQRLANEHAEGFIRMLAKERRSELSTHLETLKTQAEDLQKKLSSAEEAVAGYAQKHELVGLTDGTTQGNLMVSNLQELNRLLTNAQAQRMETESKMNKVGEKNSGENSLLDDETVKDLRTKLKEAESEASSLSQLVTKEYPKLVELQGRVDALRRIIRQEREGNLDALRTQYQASVQAEELLRKQFEEQVQKAHEMSTELVQYNLLQREASSLRDLTQSVLKSLNETKMGETTVQDNVFITDYAPLPRLPSAPRRGVILILSVLLGIMGGLGLAILCEVLDSTIKVSDDAQVALAMPTLGIIPTFKAFGANVIEKEKRFRDHLAGLIPEFIRARLPYNPSDNDDEADSPDNDGSASEEHMIIECKPQEQIVHAVHDEDEVQVIPVTHQDSGTLALSEAGVLDALRTLRANILFSSTENVSRVIMVASSREREGKTSVVSNLAVTFARASQRTLLVDGDLRGPKIARRFGIPKTQLGLVDLLAGQATLDEIIVPSWVPNLSIIPAGSPTVNPTELLGSEKMASLIAALRTKYDVILFDAAPVLPVADSLMLAQFAETVIFVVRSRRTEKAVAQEGVRRLRRVGAKVRGLVLNDFDPSDGSYSNDKYSVSKYKVFQTVYQADHTNGSSSDPSGGTPGERRAVG